jgi:two-component system, OmpR family, sensor histidine kinase KdpD
VERFVETIRGWRLVLASRRRLAEVTATVALALAVSTAAIAVFERALGLPDAFAVYLLAVVAVASRLGTAAAVATSACAFLVYDFLFVEPLYTFAISSPVEWLNLLLFFVVAIVVGRRTALLADREREASQRAREARVLFAISLDLSAAPTVEHAAASIVGRIAVDSRMRRVWCVLGAVGTEHVVADTSPGEPRPVRSTRNVLQRDTGGTPIGWARLHDPGMGREPGMGRDSGQARSVPRVDGTEIFTVPITAAGRTLGALWAIRPKGLDLPTAESTRFLAAAADQIGQAVERDRLAAEATNAEVARRSDRLKSALLDSVSHDLRTPLAAIRANAGHLLDPEVRTGPEGVAAAAATIEAEADRMNRLIGNLLDLGRIEGGDIRGDLAPYECIDLVEPVVRRLAPASQRVVLRIDVPDDLPPVLVDAVWMDQVLTNLVENAIEHGGEGMRSIRVAARPVRGDRVELSVEDDGRGVPPTELPRLFDKFHRVRPRDGMPSRGMGIGLSVVRGLVEALHGSVEARPSDLGGLAVSVTVPAVDEPPGPDDGQGEAAAGSRAPGGMASGPAAAVAAPNPPTAGVAPGPPAEART